MTLKEILTSEKIRVTDRGLCKLGRAVYTAYNAHPDKEIFAKVPEEAMLRRQKGPVMVNNYPPKFRWLIIKTAKEWLKRNPEYRKRRPRVSRTS